MLANKLWRRTTARKQAPQREPAWSQPHKPAPVTLSLVLVSRDSSRISRYPAASPESTGLTSGLPFVRRQGREHALQSSHNRLLRVVSQDPLANDSLRVDDDVGREGMNPKRLLDFSRRITILIPIHFLLGNKLAPLTFFSKASASFKWCSDDRGFSCTADRYSDSASDRFFSSFWPSRTSPRITCASARSSFVCAEASALSALFNAPRSPPLGINRRIHASLYLPPLCPQTSGRHTWSIPQRG